MVALSLIFVIEYVRLAGTHWGRDTYPDFALLQLTCFAYSIVPLYAQFVVLQFRSKLL